MKHWINTHYKSLIIGAFLVPIITVAIVSISHVTMWYGISNPVSWAIYLSIGIEIAALSALAAISADMGKKVYFPFAIVTLVQFIGNIFFAYSYININSKSFMDWVDLVSPLVSFMGVEPTDLVGHKRFLAFFAGGMLPIISLSFLHMLVKFTEEDRKKELEEEKMVNKNDVVEKETSPVKEDNKVEASYLVSEISKINLSDDDLKKLEEVLLNPPPPNENLVKAAGIYHEKIQEQLKEIEGSIEEQSIIEDEVKVDEPIVDDLYLEKEEIINDKPISVEEKTLNLKQVVFEPVEKKLTEEERKEILIEMMQKDEELGLYEPPFDNPLVKDPVVSDDFTIGPEGAFEMTDEILDQLKQEQITPALSDEEVREMFMDEWDRKFEMVEEEDFSTTEPTIEDESENFSTIEPNPENSFQENEPIVDTQNIPSEEDEKKN